MLFDVDGVASGIISAKFLRKKETDDMVFFSVPETYQVKCRVRELVNGKWTTKIELDMPAKDIREKVIAHNKDH